MSDLVQRLRLAASDLTAAMQDFQRIVAAPVLSAQQEATIRVLTDAADKIERLQDRVFAVAGERDEARHDAAQAHGVAQALERQVLSQQEACASASLAVVDLATERDTARALLRECLTWFNEGPDADRPDDLCARIDAALGGREVAS